MELELTGIISRIMPMEEGTSKAGKTYYKGGFLFNVGGEDLYVGLFGKDYIDGVNALGEGKQCICILEIKSAEYNGRFYTNVNAKRVDAYVPKAAKVSAPVQPSLDFATADMQSKDSFIDDDNGDQLPF